MVWQIKNKKNNMNTIPHSFQLHNPNGLHRKYYIQKIVAKYIGDDFIGNPKYESEIKPCDENAEYFVLRLDKNGSDPVHMEACRKAILFYAELIKYHLPELSYDLISRYDTTKAT